MKELAIAKLDKELKELKSVDERIAVMKQPVHDALVEFCRQDAEFAQAVMQGGTFDACMTAVAKGVGPSISDLDAYRRAVQFYFPGADIRMQMTVDLCASVRGDEPPRKQAVVLDLFDLLGGA